MRVPQLSGKTIKNKKKSLYFRPLLLMVMLTWLTPQTTYALQTSHSASSLSSTPSTATAPSFFYTTQTNKVAMLQHQIRQMAEELFSNLADSDPINGILADGMLVTTFVDLKKLYRTSSFGRHLSEQLMSEFQSNQYKVVEIRKSLNLRIQQRRGEYGLSREAAEINSSVTAGAMLTGTYMATAEHIIVNARILDNRTATLLSSATIIFPRNELTDILLSDAASAHSRPPEPIYMKRLEL